MVRLLPSAIIKSVLMFIICFHMAASDTSAEAEEIMCRLYRNMTIAQKAQHVFSAYRMGKMLSMAGIRIDHPDASEEQIWHLWRELKVSGTFFSVFLLVAGCMMGKTFG